MDRQDILHTIKNERTEDKESVENSIVDKKERSCNLHPLLADTPVTLLQIVLNVPWGFHASGGPLSLKEREEKIGVERLRKHCLH